MLAFNTNAALITKTLLPFLESPSNSNVSFEGEGYISFNSSGMLVSAFGANALYTKSLIQIDLRQITKPNLLSATLEFLLLDGSEGSQYTQFKGMDTDGILTPRFSNNDYFYSTTQSTTKARTIRFDLMPMIEAALDNSTRWLGVEISTRSGSDLYTRVSSNNPDRAMLRLKMDLKTSTVSEPSNILIFTMLCFLTLVGKHIKKTPHSLFNFGK